MCGMSDEPPTTEQLLALATAGDGAAWGSLLTAEQERLIRMVAFRMDPRLRGRIDAADVVQEAFVQASAHREDFFRAPEMPLFLWLRKIVSNKLFELHRHHIGTHMRDANRPENPNVLNEFARHERSPPKGALVPGRRKCFRWSNEHCYRRNWNQKKNP
jgi:DNA-directed RNA polymerase specialized sigma24 family protein